MFDFSLFLILYIQSTKSPVNSTFKICPECNYFYHYCSSLSIIFHLDYCNCLLTDLIHSCYMIVLFSIQQLERSFKSIKQMMSLKTRKRFPNIEQSVNSKSLLWSIRSFMIWSSHNSQAFHTTILLLNYYALVILVFLLLLKRVKFIPNSGPLHLLFSLQGKIFPRLTTLFIRVSSQMLFPIWESSPSSTTLSLLILLYFSS